jgi:Zn-dependent M16 (insulinase) family peptidase
MEMSLTPDQIASMNAFLIEEASKAEQDIFDHWQAGITAQLDHSKTFKEIVKSMKDWATKNDVTGLKISEELLEAKCTIWGLSEKPKNDLIAEANKIKKAKLAARKIEIAAAKEEKIAKENAKKAKKDAEELAKKTAGEEGQQ